MQTEKQETLQEKQNRFALALFLLPIHPIPITSLRIIAKEVFNLKGINPLLRKLSKNEQIMVDNQKVVLVKSETQIKAQTEVLVHGKNESSIDDYEKIIDFLAQEVLFCLINENISKYEHFIPIIQDSIFCRILSFNCRDFTHLADIITKFYILKKSPQKWKKLWKKIEFCVKSDFDDSSLEYAHIKSCFAKYGKFENTIKETLDILNAHAGLTVGEIYLQFDKLVRYYYNNDKYKDAEKVAKEVIKIDEYLVKGLKELNFYQIFGNLHLAQIKFQRKEYQATIEICEKVFQISISGEFSERDFIQHVKEIVKSSLEIMGASYYFLGQIHDFILVVKGFGQNLTKFIEKGKKCNNVETVISIVHRFISEHFCKKVAKEFLVAIQAVYEERIRGKQRLLFNFSKIIQPNERSSIETKPQKIRLYWSFRPRLFR